METQYLTQIEDAFLTAGDAANARKLRQLIDKMADQRMILAFCGHFSAGKSSMINHLLGSEVLPSSPIPTSANVVTIERGSAGARVWRKDGSFFDIPLAELTQLQELAADGEAIETIRIQHPADFLPYRVQLMDTPGIDSTDDAHRVATESALHLADAVIYMMDYNHVQSEVNFGFTKTLKDRGKTVWLVVNQIDKHNEFELPFAEYQRSVKSSFAAWGIEPDAIYYTSLREPNHPHNQMEELYNGMRQLFSRRERLLAASVIDSARYLIEEHGRMLAVQSGHERKSYLDLLGEKTDARIHAEAVNELREQIGGLESAADTLRDEMRKEIQSLIDNAILIPFQTVELCGKFLESRRPGFRVGLLFAGSKTEQEKENRLLELHKDFTGKVAANLDWHLKDLLVKFPERFGIRNEAYSQAVYDMSIRIAPAVLLGWIKEGALSSPEYMYQYAKDIAAEVKGMYRREAASFIERIADMAAAMNREKADGLRAQLVAAETLLQAASKLEQLENRLAARRNELLSLLPEEQAFAAEIDSKERKSAESVASDRSGAGAAGDQAETTSVEVVSDVSSPLTQARTVTQASRVTQASGTFPSGGGRLPLNHAAGKLRTASRTIESIPGLQTIAAHMSGRAERLEQNLFTVALFGAFSAGKSSFANALLGELVLPVSPNPTTATINKILPPTAQWEHGSVRVKLKSAADMTDDMQGSLAVFEQKVELPVGEAADSFFGKAMQLIAALDPTQVAPNAKPHFSFLQAAAKGYDSMQSLLGEELRVDMETFRQYVAQEEKACFVEWIELYYDCPLTRQGILLIDTPGADSINARHTKVAFDYIKNADAVLFVTYYNHAFSNADREFLIQLGRVKDAFELDKMFFLVNAADLASDKEELNDVTAHVRKNLIACGISQPRIYPVSSQLALLARLADKGKLPPSADRMYRKLSRAADHGSLPSPQAAVRQSGIAEFEADFLSFTIEELTETAVQSAFAEIRRAAATLTELIGTAKESETDKHRRRRKLRESMDQAKTAFAKADIETEVRSLGQEIDELLYYVRQRLFLRYSDAFNESFSSSVLRDDDRDSKRQLRRSLHELIRFLAFDLGQEMRATAVRVENQVNRGAERMFDKYVTEIASDLQGCTFEPYQKVSFPTPEFPERLRGIEDDRFAGALALYKNAKDFFERDGKVKMREEIEKRLQEPVSEYLQEASGILKSFYQDGLRNVVGQVRDNLSTEMKDYANGIEAALSMRINLEELEQTKKQLMWLLEEQQS
jgi:small GTP-binding protein